MSVEVSYPAKIVEYKVTASKDGADISLEGIEGVSLKGSAVSSGAIRRVGRITFDDGEALHDNDFVNRGGFLQMHRPLSMFCGILDLLRNEKPLFLMGNGQLSTSFEPAGEGEA